MNVCTRPPLVLHYLLRHSAAPLGAYRSRHRDKLYLRPSEGGLLRASGGYSVFRTGVLLSATCRAIASGASPPHRGPCQPRMRRAGVPCICVPTRWVLGAGAAVVGNPELTCSTFLVIQVKNNSTCAALLTPSLFRAQTTRTHLSIPCIGWHWQQVRCDVYSPLRSLSPPRCVSLYHSGQPMDLKRCAGPTSSHASRYIAMMLLMLCWYAENVRKLRWLSRVINCFRRLDAAFLCSDEDVLTPRRDS